MRNKVFFGFVTVLLLLFTTSSAYALNESMFTSWWSFEASTGEFVDYYNYQNLSNTGTANTTGIIGDSRLFDGSSDFLTAGIDKYNVNDSFSISFWLWMDASPGGGTAVRLFDYDGTTGNGIEYLLADSGLGNNKASLQMRTDIGGNQGKSLDDVSYLSVNTWYHIVFKKDGSTLTIFVDGTAPAQSTTAFGESGSTTTFYIGQESDGTDRLTGQMDEIGIMNAYIPSNDDITALYNAGAGVRPPFNPVSGGGNETSTVNNEIDLTFDLTDTQQVNLFIVIYIILWVLIILGLINVIPYPIFAMSTLGLAIMGLVLVVNGYNIAISLFALFLPLTILFIKPDGE